MNIPTDELRRLEELRDETGIPVSKLIDLQRRGYEIHKRG